MTRYLLDTTELIAAARERDDQMDRLARLAGFGDQVGTCSVAVAEFYSGQPTGYGPAMDGFIASLTYWVTPLEAAVVAGEYRLDARRRGRTLTVADALVAATAEHYRAVVVTDNLKDFMLPGITAIRLADV